jgi:hypothetical protein
MRTGNTFLRARSRALWVALTCAAAIGAVFACNGRLSDIHDSADVKGKACYSCHSSAYNTATNPVHVNVMPLTCQDCHDTKAWSPSSVKDHYWWPIENKHVGVSCAACHTKGYKLGDTPKDCIGCHRKDYESSVSPPHHALNVDQYPLDCTMCHTTAEPDHFKPSPWTHYDAGPPPYGYELIGSHRITVIKDDAGNALLDSKGDKISDHNPDCNGCHLGTPRVYQGTPTDCYTCHKDEFDNLAPTKNANHPTFPHTCLDCHIYSGWTQGPPISGLHPDRVNTGDGGTGGFPLEAGAGTIHAGIACQDCHKFELGLPQGGQNVDCTGCHTATAAWPAGAHASPAIDSYHLVRDGGPVAGYPNGATSKNFCVSAPCHLNGQHR